jgi:N utilization substance protein B
MARVDRNILRIASYEILYRPEIPLNVTINEAIEVAKRFGSDDSPMFINGVLDRVAKLLQKETGQGDEAFAKIKGAA